MFPQEIPYRPLRVILLINPLLRKHHCSMQPSPHKHHHNIPLLFQFPYNIINNPHNRTFHSKMFQTCSNMLSPIYNLLIIQHKLHHTLNNHPMVLLQQSQNNNTSHLACLINNHIHMSPHKRSIILSRSISTIHLAHTLLMLIQTSM